MLLLRQKGWRAEPGSLSCCLWSVGRGNFSLGMDCRSFLSLLLLPALQATVWGSGVVRPALHVNQTQTKHTLTYLDDLGANLFSYLQGRDHFIPNFLGGNKVTGHFGVNDPIFLLPADYDGFLSMCSAAHLLLLALRCQGGVWVGSYHSWN